MTEPSSSAWDCFPCLETVFAVLQDAAALAQCAAVCRAWRGVLSSINGPWAAALEHE